MIDTNGFRIGVGMIVCNAQDKVLLAKRIGRSIWQFPQGGMQSNETPETALYRELYEELGLISQDVKLLGHTKDWLHYRFPAYRKNYYHQKNYVGQKQKWFLLRLLNENTTIRFDSTDAPEFDKWRWVNYWYPLKQAISFKQEVYRLALKELVVLLSNPSKEKQ